MNELQSLQVSGFKSIRDATIDLHRVNVLIGANGAGKSNLLSVFRMLNAMLTSSVGLRVFVADQGRARALLHGGPRATPRMHIALSFRVDNATNTYDATWGVGADDSLYFAAESAAHHRDNSALPTSLDLGAGHLESGLPGAINRGDRTARTVKWNLDRWRFYHFHDTSMHAPLRSASPLVDNRYLHGDGGNLPSFLRMLREAHPASYATILAAIRQVAPFFDDFVLEATDDPERTVALEWRERGSTYPFFAHHLSDGLLRFIALAAVLLQPNLETRPLLVVIDEPELGLHPAAIRVLARLVERASSHMQILVSTQSPALVDYFDPEQILVAERTDRGSEFRRLDSAALEEWMETYSLGELWEKNVLGGRPGFVPSKPPPDHAPSGQPEGSKEGS